jgi:hypothetical protein
LSAGACHGLSGPRQRFSASYQRAVNIEENGLNHAWQFHRETHWLETASSRLPAARLALVDVTKDISCVRAISPVQGASQRVMPASINVPRSQVCGL